MKFLVYLDILGFEELAEKLARQTGQVASHVREAFMRTINERIDASYATGMVCSKWWGRSDSWLMVADTMDSAVEACAKMIEHHTGFESVPHLPLELAIGTGVYDAWAVLEDEQLVCQESTIRFLKSNIISRYKQSHKAMRGGSIHKSFVLLTESAYAVLDPVDKLKCTKAGRAPVYYTIHTHQLTQRAEVYDFLRQIGHAGSRLYNRIDELYVQPVEYSYIDECLAEKRLVFITGTAEYGKTFTAVRLLYEYFKKGYRPLWLTGSEETERRVGRMKLEDIDSILTEHTIVYFEDPFGKLKYEKRESLERQIASVVDRIHNYIDAFVVITSREEIFREFKKEKLSLLELETFERKLNITRPSYDAGRRQQILVNWATAMGCCWAENENLKNLVTKRLEDKANLPTPLCIKDFAIASVNVVRASQLIALIARKSIETEMSFALEVRQMGKDQIIFLCLPFLGQFTVDFVREQYERLLKDLSVPAARSFDELLTCSPVDR
ncbi:MAG: hypothetical protein OEW00_09050, partial [candidate division Zixibacteria bacterium]|nr:hypothetical protein [candidate division Zixibacteria bacterium]